MVTVENVPHSNWEAMESLRSLTLLLDELDKTGGYDGDSIARKKFPDFIREANRILDAIGNFLTCASLRHSYDVMVKCLNNPECVKELTEEERRSMENTALDAEVALREYCPSIFHQLNRV